MEQSEISEQCGVTASSISRDFNGTEFKNTDATIDVNLLFASSSDIAIKLQKKYAALQLNQYKAQTEIAKNQLNAIQNELDATKNKLDATHSETVQQQTELMQFETKTEQLEIALNELKQENTNLKKLSDTATEKTKTCDTLQNELKTITSDKNKLETELSEAIQELNSNKADCNDLQTTCNDLATQNKSLQHKAEQLQGELDNLGDAKQKIEKLENENEVQRSELLMLATGTDKENKLQVFFTSLGMVQFYMVIVMIGTFIVAYIEWNEVIQNKAAVAILAFVLSTSIIFTSFNKTQNKYINILILSVFVYVEFTNSAKLTGLFDTVLWTSKWFKSLGGALLLPTISVFVAHLNTKQSVTYQLDVILNAVGVVAKKHGIDNVLRFKNDLIEKLNK
jgi:predicted  nucleic acid-binding Zn-ribbon protein